MVTQQLTALLCARFSKRHREIDAQLQRLLAAHPEKASKNVRDIRERLAHKQRSRKRQDVPRERLRQLWQDQLEDERPGDVGVACES